jgi:hypothetical protein
MWRSTVLLPDYLISIRECPSNGLQIYHICSLNSVYLPPLSPYTYFRDQIAMGPFDCEHIPATAGTGEMNVACMNSKQRRSNYEKDSMFSRNHSIVNAGWALTLPRNGINIPGKRSF